jgi:CRISPR-associated exonuclease Cas4
MIYWIAFLLFAAIILFLLAKRLRSQTGLPGGRVIYSDTHQWGRPIEKPLFDGSLGITGKPDYILEKNGELIPVEVKSSRAPRAPYDAHILQLAIYCLLVEKVYQRTPRQGYIHYPGKTFEIDFNQDLRERTLAMISEMHQLERHKSLPRTHEDAGRCARCGYHDICDQRL